MQIGSRISAGFAVVVGLSAVVGVVGWISLSSVVSAARVSRMADDLVLRVKTAHAEVMRFDMSGDEQAAGRIRTILADVGPLLEGLIGAAPWSGEDVDAARGAVAGFGQSFAALAEAQRSSQSALAGMARRNDEIAALVEKLQRGTGGDQALRDEIVAMRLNLSAMGRVEEQLRAGRIEDGTDGMMLSLRAVFVAGMKLRQSGNDLLTQGAATIAETMHDYRKEFENVRAAAESRRETGEGIRTAAERLETLFSQVAAQEKAHMENVQRNARGMLLLGVLTGLLAGSGLAVWLTGTIVRPVHALTGSMKRLAEGDLAVAVPGLGRADEIGAMARAVEVFKDNAGEVQRLQGERAQREAAAERERREVRERLAGEIGATLGSVANAVAEAAERLEASARTLTDSSAQGSRQALSVASAARQVLSNVETVSAATEELSASAAEIGRRARESSDIARHVRSETRRSDEILEVLAQSAGNIAAVVNMITTIAAQTNLLALNATIEASRAGEAGKGFAVVADEVKGLATQTNQATGAIGRQVEDIQGRTRDAVEALDKVGATIARMENLSAEVASTVDAQATATHDIVGNLSQAAAGTREVSQTIDAFAEAADLARREAANVLEAAGGLGRQAATLRRELDALVARIRQQ
mgnify:CR=1 FL=1